MFITGDIEYLHGTLFQYIFLVYNNTIFDWGEIMIEQRDVDRYFKIRNSYMNICKKLINHLEYLKIQDDKVYGFVLSEKIKLTDSDLGYVNYLLEDELFSSCKLVRIGDEFRFENTELKEKLNESVIKIKKRNDRFNFNLICWILNIILLYMLVSK